MSVVVKVGAVVLHLLSGTLLESEEVLVLRRKVGSGRDVRQRRCMFRGG